MKSKKIVTILIAIIILGFFSVGGIILQKKFSSSAAVVEGNLIKNVPIKDSAYALGTEQNPFLVLEIVPFEGFAEIGYNIAGQEPVNIEVLSWSNTKGGNIASTGAFVTTGSSIKTFSPPDAMIQANEYTTSIVPQDGCYKKVDPNQGNYIQTTLYRDKDGKVTGADFKEVAANTGDFVLEWLDYNPSRLKNDQDENKIYTTKSSTLYDGYHYEYQNKNIFLRECLQVPDDLIDSYQIKVMTVTSNQLNKNIELIDKADLIYLTDKNHMGTTYIDIWKDQRFRRTDMFQYNEDNLTNYGNYRFINGRDLSWEAVVKILQKKSGCDLADNVNPCPVIYDVNCLTTSIPMVNKSIKKKTLTSTYSKDCDASENNVYKLGLLMRYDNTAKLYDLYFKTNMIVMGNKASDGMSTGLFCNADGTPVSTYWCPFILIPYHLVAYNNNSNIMNSNVEKKGYSTAEGYSDTYNTMAKDGMYIYNANSSMVMQFNTPIVSNTSQTKEAFEYYNLGVSDKITPARIIRFLLDRANDGANIPSLSILEIQPFEDYKQDWQSYIKSLLPSFRGKLNITAMTSKEFICRIEELVGTYDMVYLGMNKDKALDYQKLDLELSSLAYSHVGQRIQVKNDGSMASWIYGNYGNFYTRYSGNDITKLKKEALVQFIQAGYPIMLAANMSNGSTISPQIDISSYLYDFISTVNKPAYSAKLLTENAVTGYTFNQVLNKASLEVTFSRLPQEYKDAITEKQKTGKVIDAKDIYINGGDDDKRVLTYEFVITDDGTDSIYSAALYLDQNADGLFDKSKEELKGLTIKDKETKATCAATKLKAGRTYVLERGVSDYSGVITWQLSFEKSSKKDGSYLATGLKSIKTGVSAIQNKGSKEKIKVLQIASDNAPSIYLPTLKNIQDSNVAGLTDRTAISEKFVGHVFKKNGTTKVDDNDQARTTGLFYYYLNNLQDYEIIIERCYVSDFNTKMEAATPGINLNNYQMLILGFADVYSDITSSKGRKAIEDFIDQGKTVLFTHDTTMYNSDYDLSQHFRDKFGMDRFGTMQMGTSIPSKTTLESLKYDLAYYPNSTNTNKLLTISESYGFTNQHIKRYAVKDTPSTFFDDALTTTNVTNINKGQITKYPYEIPDKISVVKTHGQYFQLDMEDPEIVVWYSLANKGTNTEQLAYDKNDGRNGYYIYNKGNITYSGAGHISGDIGVMPDDEVKLFVNTIIAAYRATPFAAEVVVTNEDKSSNEANNTDYLLVDYDSENKEMAFGSDVNISNQTKKIYFKLDDQSLYKKSEFEIKYYIKQDDPLTVNVEYVTLNVKTYDKDGEIGNDQVKANTEDSYYTEVKLDKLREETSMDIMMELILTYKNDDNVDVELKSYRYVQLLRRGLFNLD